MTGLLEHAQLRDPWWLALLGTAACLGASHSGQQNDRHYSVRLYALHEIRALLERNGFRVDEISGREATLGIFFGVHSPKMIIRAERLPGPFSGAGNTPPPVPPSTVPKGALRPSDFPEPRGDQE